MSQMTYNGVTLPYVNITKFDQRALYDPSETDWYCVEFDISANCTINSSYIQVNTGGSNATNPADITGLLTTLLLKSRKTLSVKFNGVELIPQKAGVTGTVDAQNGPKPQFCNIISMTDTTFLLLYGIKASYWVNAKVNANSPIISNQAGSPVLYNRWSETADIDTYNYTKRTREGKVLIRSDNKQGFVADQVRNQMAVVGVPENFLREDSNYVVDPSGLGLAYRVTDREVYKMPPKPAFTAEGEYTESAPKAGGPIRYGEVRVRLKGARTLPTTKVDPQTYLVQTAISVAVGKLTANCDGLKPYNIIDARVSVGLYDNWVEVYMKAMYELSEKEIAVTPAVSVANAIIAGVLGAPLTIAFPAFTGIGTKIKGPGAGPNGVGPGMTYTPGTDGEEVYTPPYLNRGSAGLLLQTAAYYDPSLADNELVAGAPITSNNPLTATRDGRVQLNHGLQPGRAGLTPEG